MKTLNNHQSSQTKSHYPTTTNQKKFPYQVKPKPSLKTAQKKKTWFPTQMVPTPLKALIQPFSLVAKKTYPKDLFLILSPKVFPSHLKLANKAITLGPKFQDLPIQIDPSLKLL